jgi:GTP cyclohydrolase I
MRDKFPIEEAVRSILRGVGENIEREGLLDTPARVARMYLEMTRGLREEPPKVTTFSAKGDCQMVTVLGIDYHSLCEHHLVPFYGQAHIGYLAYRRLAGLSKFARVVDYFAARPQIQEVMTDQIAAYLQDLLVPRGLIVVVEGHHMCMSARGVKKQNHRTVTSAIRGDIPKDEFFDILKTLR